MKRDRVVEPKIRVNGFCHGQNPRENNKHHSRRRANSLRVISGAAPR
jgi:hypothetical protein